MATAQVVLQLQTAAAPQLAQVAGGTKALTAAQVAQITAAQRLATETQKTASASQRLQTEEQKTARETANAAAAQDRAALSALRLAQAQEKAAHGSGLTAQFADAIKSSFLGILGPAALVATALGAATAAAQSFGDAFKFKADLDATNLSIQTNLNSVRDSAAVFREAERFADRYRLTQKETSDILSNSTDILRTSTSGVAQLEAALLRLQSRDVSKPISEAARALRELNSGDTTTIKEVFNVSADQANRMKAEIQGGRDAVQVLTDYLDRAGVGMEVLENRSKGVKGAINEAAIAQERLALAQAQIAEGPGAAATNVQASALNLLAGQLSGNTKATAEYTASIFQNFGAVSEVLTALGLYSHVLAGNELQHISSSSAILKSADADDRRAAAALRAIPAIDARTEAEKRLALATGFAEQRAGERKPGASGRAEVSAADEARQQQIFARLAQPEKDRQAAAQKQRDEKAANDAKRLDDLRNQNRLINARTTAARIQELERQRAASSDPIERQEIQNRIDQERLSAAKSHTSELNKQLGLQERVYDSVNKQREAELEIEEARIRDRQQDREDADRVRLAQKILAATEGRTDDRALAFRGRAEDAIALADVQNRRREFELQQKLATAGASIVNGRLYQSLPGQGGLPPAPTTLPPSDFAAPPGGAQAPPSAGKQVQLVIPVTIDGKVAWQAMGTYAYDELMRALDGQALNLGVR